MCNYVINGHRCKATNQICPYMYFCNIKNIWKPNKNMPENCATKRRAEVPKGYTLVRMARKNKLYIDIDHQTFEFDNPFDYIPEYVKLTKTKTGWKIKTK